MLQYITETLVAHSGVSMAKARKIKMVKKFFKIFMEIRHFEV